MEVSSHASRTVGSFVDQRQWQNVMQVSEHTRVRILEGLWKLLLEQDTGTSTVLVTMAMSL